MIGRSRGVWRLVNVAAIRSTGMTASLAIAERVGAFVGAAGVDLGDRGRSRGEVNGAAGPWWRRTADYRRRRDDAA